MLVHWIFKPFGVVRDMTLNAKCFLLSEKPARVIVLDDLSVSALKSFPSTNLQRLPSPLLINSADIVFC